MARICFLVLAHAAPGHFGLLADALGPDADLVVHVDAKADLAPFRAAAPGAHFVEDRVKVTWAGWSQVEAILRLMETGRSAFPEATHLWLISGDSYPLRPVPVLERFLGAHPDRQHIDLVRMPDPENAKPLRRLSRFHVEHDARTSRWHWVLRQVPRVARRPWYRAALRGRTLYTGGTWWTLTAGAVDEVLGVARSRDPWTRLCRTSFCPDEHYVHTVVGNSPWRADVAGDLMYTDWNGPWPLPRPMERRHAELLAGGEVERDGSAPLFARKFADDGGEVVAAFRDLLW